MGCDQIRISEHNSDSNVVIELCNFIKEINYTDEL